MKPTREQLRELLRVIQATRPQEIDCQEFLARVAAFLEAREPGKPLPPELAAVAQHLEVCLECSEEFDALVAAHQGSEDPGV